MAVPTVTIYRNGDLHFFGKKLVVNQKRISTFNNFLDKVTQDTHAKVAIRRLCTPNNGTRVAKLDQLQNGGVYVAVGPEKFKRLQYDKLRATHPTIQARKQPKQNIKPVLHSRIYASARYHKVALAEPLKNRIIFVYRNGDATHNGIKLLLDKHLLADMNNVLQYITDKIKLRTGAVKSLHTIDGIHVKEPKDIVTGNKYVAVGYGKPFMKTIYSDSPFTSITPRRTKQSNYSDSTDSPPKHKTQPRRVTLRRKTEHQTVTENAEEKLNRKNRKWQSYSKTKQQQQQQENEASLDNAYGEISDSSAVSKGVAVDDNDEKSFFERLTDNIEDTVDDLSDYNTKKENTMKSSYDKTDNYDINDDSIIKDSLNVDDVYENSQEKSDDISKDLYDQNVENAEQEVIKEKSATPPDTNETSTSTKKKIRKISKKSPKKKKSKGFGSVYVKKASVEVENQALNDSMNSHKSMKDGRQSVDEDVNNINEDQPSPIGVQPAPASSPIIDNDIEETTNVSLDQSNDDHNITYDVQTEQSVLNQSNTSLNGVPSPDREIEEEPQETILEASHYELKTEDNVAAEDDESTTTNTAFSYEAKKDGSSENEQQQQQQENIADTADIEDIATKAANSAIFSATGDQSETAAPVKDNQDTQIEETLDMQTAEEVVDEEIIDDDINQRVEDQTRKKSKQD